MPIYIKDNLEILFIHIPKCAGTSIEKVLRASTSFEYLFSKNKIDRICTPQHFHADILSNIAGEKIPSFT